MKYLTHFLLFVLAMLVGAGCTMIKYVKTERDPYTGKETKTEFTHYAPIFVKRDMKELDILQGRMVGFSGGVDPQTGEIMRSVTEGAVQGAIKAMKP